MDPHSIASLPTVPLLADTWERVALSVGQAKELNELDADREHGAAQVWMP